MTYRQWWRLTMGALTLAEAAAACAAVSGHVTYDAACDWVQRRVRLALDRVPDHQRAEYLAASLDGALGAAGDIENAVRWAADESPTAPHGPPYTARSEDSDEPVPGGVPPFQSPGTGRATSSEVQ